LPEEYKYDVFDEMDDTSNIDQTMPDISTRQKTGFLPSLFTRLLLYLLVYTLIIETCVMLSLKGYADIIFKEDNLVEWFQLGTLVATSIFMYLASKKHSTLTDAFHVLMILPLIASARELDRFFEHLIAEVTWRILVVMLTLYLISYFWKRFYTIKKQFQEFMRTNSFGFMCSGFFIVMVFSRLFGQKVLWKTMMGEDYVRLAVRVMEEGCELVGYFFILTGAMECLFARYDKLRK
jgi:hypothetical protein